MDRQLTKKYFPAILTFGRFVLSLCLLLANACTVDGNHDEPSIIHGITSAPNRSLCISPRPSSHPLFHRSDPRVAGGLSTRTLAFNRLPAKCQIDHRTFAPKSFQHNTGFCHVHAFTELWNSSVPPVFSIDTASLSLQIWILSMGNDLSTILANEVKFIRQLRNDYPLHRLLGLESRFLLSRQGGLVENDLKHIQNVGYYNSMTNPGVDYLEVERLTDKVVAARADLIRRSIQGLSDAQIRRAMEPIFQEIMDKAWRSRAQASEWAQLEPMQRFAQRFSLKVLEYKDSPEARLEFFKALGAQPIVVSARSHAMLVAGYDESNAILWIRDSASIDSYYQVEIERFLPTVYRYYVLESTTE